MNLYQFFGWNSDVRSFRIIFRPKIENLFSCWRRDRKSFGRLCFGKILVDAVVDIVAFAVDAVVDVVAFAVDDVVVDVVVLDADVGEV